MSLAPAATVGDSLTMRLNRYLAAAGVASRRAVEAFIQEGRVAVNGSIVTELATFVSPDRDTVTVDGEPVKPPLRHTYYVLHKPAGYVTTADDPHGRRTVLELVPDAPRVFPVGRLDMNTTGLLLLTNDGSLTHRILHPKYELEKEYRAVVQGKLEDFALTQLRSGPLLEDGPTSLCSADVLETGEDYTVVRVILHEGRKRQVRRMLEAVGHPATELHRSRVGPITLGSLPEGKCRELEREELRKLRALLEAG